LRQDVGEGRQANQEAELGPRPYHGRYQIKNKLKLNF
jgi:hypothetical protein